MIDGPAVQYRDPHRARRLVCTGSVVELLQPEPVLENMLIMDHDPVNSTKAAAGSGPASTGWRLPLASAHPCAKTIHLIALGSP